MRVADGLKPRLLRQRRIEVHRTAAGDEKHMLDALVGNELEDVIGKLHGFFNSRALLAVDDKAPRTPTPLQPTITTMPIENFASN